MSNRRRGGRATPRKLVAEKPINEFGIECNKVPEGVQITLYMGTSTFTTVWNSRDAAHIASMIEKASMGEDMPEVVRGSGLVVPSIPAGGSIALPRQ
jgi:hypothetical protein